MNFHRNGKQNRDYWGLRGRGKGFFFCKLLFNGDRVFVLDDEKDFGIDSTDNHTTL